MTDGLLGVQPTLLFVFYIDNYYILICSMFVTFVEKSFSYLASTVNRL